MQELEKYLQEAINQSKFTVSWPDHHDPQKKSLTSRQEHISPEKLRALWQNGRRCLTILLEGDIPSTLVDYLNEKLEKYIDEDDRFWFRAGYDIHHHHTVRDFASLAIKAAVLLTPAKTAKLLSSWFDGQPFQYKIVSLINSVSCEKSLSIGEDIKVNKLPEHGYEFPEDLIPHGQPQNQYFKGVTLSFNVKTAPVFYKGRESQPEQTEYIFASKKISTTLIVDDFCEALSLSCNHCILPVNMWVNSKDILVFNQNSFLLLVWPLIHIPKSPPLIPLSQELLNDAWKIYSRRSDTETKFLDVSIEHWLKSKQHESNMINKLIDLRVALETLYLNDNISGELRFRLATRGARHLGKTFEERKKYYKALLDAYDLTSKAVHSGEIYQNKKSRRKEKYQKILRCFKDAQNICREGILKMLCQGKPDWNEIIFR